MRPLLRFWKLSRTLRWGVLVGVVLFSAVAMVLAFLLAQTGNNRHIYERNYSWLLGVNMVLAAVLLLVLLWMGWRMWQRLRAGKFGSRLLLKLAAVFVLVASVPGALLYVVSYQFVSRSIDSWFDLRVESALDAGLNLGRNVLDALSADTASKAQAAARQLGLSAQLTAALELELERLRLQTNASQMLLWSASGELLASAGQQGFLRHQASAPDAQDMQRLQAGQTVSRVEGLDAATDMDAQENLSAWICAYVQVRNPVQFGALERGWVLQVVQDIAPELLHNALLVQEANAEYQERALARTGMQRMFIATLTLTLFLAVFGAVVMAVLLATQLARPLLLLAQGVKEVSEGDLRPKTIYQGNDELGNLTRAFADMTQQLHDARHMLTSSMAELDAARSSLQTVLDNLTAGVAVLALDGTPLLCNPSAERILRAPRSQWIEQPALQALWQSVQQQFALLAQEAEAAQPSPAGFWQHTFVLPFAPEQNLQQPDALTLMLRGAPLPGPKGAQPQRLLVLDDISAIVSAQRAQAWSEVARRLAHEIKNPLTPIRLSAERLQRRLMEALPPLQQGVLSKSVGTIVQQVEAMQRLVDEFRDYARLPAAQLQATDLNALIADVLQLYETDATTVPIDASLDPACCPILADAQQLRQVLHNLLQNAQDAQLQAGRAREPVALSTQWRPATQRVRLSISDSGGGFAPHILQRAFEPYVTTKAKGTGLGLAVVKKIADEHGARLHIANRLDEHGQVLGAQISLLFQSASEEKPG